MSKRKREKMKEKAARHAKSARSAGDGAVPSLASTNTERTGKKASVNTNNKATPKSESKSTVSSRQIDLKAEHFKGMSPAWRKLYEEIAKTAR
ncbi:hypothetical protein [Paenibacillus oceani]|uniref:Uncharacterized protein n=1 Tax=Paenibacillus oceani TaxID=2772510 RepID=A0A927CB46_9BACL|nr:hypothetical protein [Paenibacillus oceani]MBD2864794.1 hypothetical protein [Paenibacillus oceani]